MEIEEAYLLYSRDRDLVLIGHVALFLVRDSYFGVRCEALDRVTSIQIASLRGNSWQ